MGILLFQSNGWNCTAARFLHQLFVHLRMQRSLLLEQKEKDKKEKHVQFYWLDSRFESNRQTIMHNKDKRGEGGYFIIFIIFSMLKAKNYALYINQRKISNHPSRQRGKKRPQIQKLLGNIVNRPFHLLYTSPHQKILAIIIWKD